MRLEPFFHELVSLGFMVCLYLTATSLQRDPEPFLGADKGS